MRKMFIESDKQYNDRKYLHVIKTKDSPRL